MISKDDYRIAIISGVNIFSGYTLYEKYIAVKSNDLMVFTYAHPCSYPDDNDWLEKPDITSGLTASYLHKYKPDEYYINPNGITCHKTTKNSILPIYTLNINKFNDNYIVCDILSVNSKLDINKYISPDVFSPIIQEFNFSTLKNFRKVIDNIEKSSIFYICSKNKKIFTKSKVLTGTNENICNLYKENKNIFKIISPLISDITPEHIVYNEEKIILNNNTTNVLYVNQSGKLQCTPVEFFNLNCFIIPGN